MPRRLRGPRREALAAKDTEGRGLWATVLRWGGLIRLRMKLTVKVTRGFLHDFDLGILVSIAFSCAAVAVCDHYDLEVSCIAPAPAALLVPLLCCLAWSARRLTSA